ncbi:MAG TPA: HIT domain-containing protein [Candidatus Dormibacteraeota bacterium]
MAERSFVPDDPDCVFCAQAAQPVALRRGRHVHTIPDLYPVVPGHLLLVSREHLPSYGAASPVVTEELQSEADLAMRFVHQSYGVEPLLWENGGAGQTVFHAHLHVMPVALHELEEVIESEHMTEVGGWDDVRRHWEAGGSYHYLQFRGHRRLAEGNGAANWEFRRRVAIAAGLRYQGGRWVRPTTADDVGDVQRRWGEWVGVAGETSG